MIMEQEQPVGDIGFPFKVVGRILAAIGVVCMVLYLVPFIAAYSNKASSKKIIENAAAEKSRLEPLMSAANRRIILLSNGYGASNPAKVSGGREKIKLEAEYRQLQIKYNSVSRGEYTAEQVLEKSQKTMDSTGIFAGLSIALVVTGIIFVVFPKDV